MRSDARASISWPSLYHVICGAGTARAGQRSANVEFCVTCLLTDSEPSSSPSAVKRGDTVPNTHSQHDVKTPPDNPLGHTPSAPPLGHAPALCPLPRSYPLRPSHRSCPRPPPPPLGHTPFSCRSTEPDGIFFGKLALIRTSDPI